jgi:hypothetical protein
LQFAFDNTDRLLLDIDTSTAPVATLYSWLGFTMHWPENDLTVRTKHGRARVAVNLREAS